MKRDLRQSGGCMLGWDVILFFALYVLMPSYCAVEISASLPLITVSRGLLVLMGLMLLIRRRKDLFNLRKLDVKALNFGLTGDKFLRWGLLIYFVLLVICDIVLLPTDMGEALKATFVVVVEGYALVWMLTLILDTREKLLIALKALVIASGVTAVIAMLGCVLGFNPFHYLDTVKREMLMTSYYRLGLLRAEAGFGHPVYYGVFCAVVSPINMYFVENSEKPGEKRLFSVCLALNMVGLVLSNSRGSMFAFGCMVILAAVLRILAKDFKKFFATYLPIGLTALGILAVVSLLSPAGLKFLQGIVNSLLSAVFPNAEISLDVVTRDNEVITYGENAAGGRSRMAQMTGILWTLEHEPLFGFGSNAHVRGLVRYQYYPGKWSVTDTFDVGLVAIICQYGLVGLVGYTALYGSVFKTVVSKKYRGDSLMYFLGLAFITYMLCLITIATLLKTEWVLIAVIVCLVNIIRKESQNDAA